MYTISTEINAPGENGLNFYKLTDEADGVLGGLYSMDINPVTNEFAFVAERDGAYNIFIKNNYSAMTSKQRTFRKRVDELSYSHDGKNIVFAETIDENSILYITDAYVGSICHQLASGWRGNFSPNDSTIIFDKLEIVGKKSEFRSGGCFSAGYYVDVPQYERSLWGYNISNSQLFTITKGEAATMIPSEPSSMYCVRNEKEIWKINMKTGAESIIYTHKNRIKSLELSPKEDWIAFVSVTENTIKGRKYKNDDIFFIKTDGSNFIQLTYHEADDTCPIWINGGKNLLLISARGNTDKKYNVWKIDNPLYK